MKPQKKRSQSVLGLSLADGQLRAAHVIRGKGGRPEVAKAASAALTLDVLHPEPELVGREIKNHLETAGIKEKTCIVAVPARWVMSQHIKVPALSGEDATSFLELEAEKGFPVDPAELQIARSFQRVGGETYVTQLAVRREHLERLAIVVKAAGLRPVSFSLGLAALPDAVPAGERGRLTVAVDPAQMTLLLAAGGGIAALRTSEASIDTEAGEKLVNGPAISRELRITVEQVPAPLRAQVRQLFLTGDSTMARQLSESLADWARAAGLVIERGDLPEKDLATEIVHQLGARWLMHGAVELEFLPPRPSRWATLMARYSSKRLATAGFAAAAIALLLAGAFGWRSYQLWSLRSEWAGMQARVTQLDGVQARIREFRPWFDTSFRALTVLKNVTECFPETGTVNARSFELRGSTITISGTLRDRASLLRVHDALSKLKDVQTVKIDQIRAPQFTMTVHLISNPAPRT